MLYSMRKNLGKWKIALWPVAISIAASSLTMITRSLQVSTIARINGESVSYRSFMARKREFEEQIAMRRNEARSRGIPADLYLQLSGLTNPIQSTLDALVYENVIAGALDPLWVRLDDEVVSRELLKGLPADFLDAAGNVDMQVYRRFMQMTQRHVAEFEDRKEEEMQRDLFFEFVQSAGYLSNGQCREIIEKSVLKKSFNVAKIEFASVKGKISKEDVSSTELESYYESNKEQYRVAENRSFAYWVVSPSVAERKVSISDEALSHHYEKNKNSLYRIAPRVKVRHILVSADTENGRSVADELHSKISADPSLFEKLAQEYSADKETARVGGVRDFFSRGTYEKAFETAAFRLKQPLDIAPVVKVEGGFEIIQLVERIPGGVRPFAEVRDEIEKSVRAKKAMDWIRTHLEKIKKDASGSKDAIKEITETAESSKELNGAQEAKGNSHTIEGLIIKNGFTIPALEGYSFFSHNDSYVLVQLKKKEGSYIRPYKEVANQVEQDLVGAKAAEKVHAIAQAVIAAVRGGADLADACEPYGVDVKVSDAVGASQTEKGLFKNNPSLLKKSFGLSGSGQVLLHFAGNDAYLTTLHKVDQDSRGEVDTALSHSGSLDTELSEESSTLSQAVISSLLRTAQVEFDQKLLATGQREEPVPYDM